MKEKVNKIMEKIARKHNMLLSCAILFTCAMIYAPFIFGDYALIYTDIGYDTYHQYYPVYKFFAQLFRDGRLPEYSFAYGLGTSIFASIAWIADPFSIINSLCGAIWGIDSIGLVLVFTQILKIWCAGLLCRYFLKTHKRSDIAASIAAYIFSFSGFMMTSGQHYFFSVYPIYLLAVLIGVDKTFKKRSNGIWLMLITLLICARGAYSTYMILLSVAFYVIIQSLLIHEGNIRKAIADIAYIGFTLLFGLLISMVVFLPQLGTILFSNRLTDSSSSLLERILMAFEPSNWTQVKSQLLRLFSSNLEGSANKWTGYATHWEMFACGFSILFVPMAGQYLVTPIKKPIITKVLVGRLLQAGLFVFAMLSNFIPNLFNVFAYPTYRYSFVFLPVFALVFAVAFDDAYHHDKFNRTLNYVFIAACIAFVCCFGKTETCDSAPYVWTCVSLLIGGILMDLLFLSRKALEAHNCRAGRQLSNILCSLLVLVIGVNLALENGYTLFYERQILSKERTKTEVLDSGYTASVEHAAQLEDDCFYRIESASWRSDYPHAMYSLVTPSRSASFYDTTVHQNIDEFLTRICNSTATFMPIYQNNDYHTTRSTLLCDLLGIKYIVASGRSQSIDWQLLAEYENEQLFRNNHLNSAGLIFDQFVTEEQANAVDLATRMKILTQAVILEEDPQKLDGYAQQQLSLENALDQVKNNAILPEECFCYDQVTVDSEDLEDGYVKLTTHQEFDGFQIFLPLNSDVMELPNSTRIFRAYVEGSGEITEVLYKDAGNFMNCKLICQQIGKNAVYTAIVPEETEYIVLTIRNAPEEFVIDKMCVENVEHAYSTEGIDLINPNMEGYVSGCVVVNKPSILYLPIPYDGQWEATIDGNKTEIMNANYGFSAVLLQEGTHQIMLNHENTMMIIGQNISLVALVAYIAFFIGVDRVGKRKNKMKPQERSNI